MRVKICGATDPADIALLAGLAVDLVGLWHGTGGGHAELSLPRLAALADAARATGGPEPVLVTLEARPGVLAEVLAATGLRWVQLHGYQPPAVVRAVKATGATVVKALHVRGRDCVERPLIRAYERAGTDLFLFDSATADGRVGSTGRRLDAAAAAELAAATDLPFLVAGGVSADRPADPVAAHPRCVGVDADSGARGADRALCGARVAAIAAAWRGAAAAAGRTDRPGGPPTTGGHRDGARIPAEARR
ncbi:MAG TPA: hypothetical protein VNV66_19770 [Pilimelia sp.]|nr:hypothetical protein [Pilimelia sp.]